jgi:hypothetical protein
MNTFLQTRRRLAARNEAVRYIFATRMYANGYRGGTPIGETLLRPNTFHARMALMDATHTPHTTLLPSMQFAIEYSILPDESKTYLTTAGKVVCKHGECSSTICYWLANEKKAREEGRPIPERGGSRGISACDCQTTEGLNVKVGDDVSPPEPPSSLFEYLQSKGTEEIVVKGNEARCIPYLPGPTFVTARGRICCRHGASRQSLIKSKRAMLPSTHLPKCGCVLKAVPTRSTGWKTIQLGKYVRKKPLLVLDPNTSCSNDSDSQEDVCPPVSTCAAVYD